MILGIGVDIVENKRFSEWENYPQKKLSSIFTAKEIELFTQTKYKNPEQFFASRFAAKEAFFKALSNSLITLDLTKETFSFQFARKNVEIVQTIWEIPELKVNWDEFEDKLNIKLPKIKITLSFAHEKEFSVAFVVLSK